MNYWWPDDGSARLLDGLTEAEVIQALFAPRTRALTNQVPSGAPTTLIVCAPTDRGRLITVVCVRVRSNEQWRIFSARDADAVERSLWRKEMS